MKTARANFWRRCPKGAQDAQRSKQGILGIFEEMAVQQVMFTSLLGLGITPGNQLVTRDDRAPRRQANGLRKAWAGLDPAPEGCSANAQQLGGLLGAIRLGK